MKKIINRIIIFLLIANSCLFSLDIPKDIDTDKDYYKAAMQSWKEKDLDQAVYLMRYSFFQEQTAYRLFWYCYFLKENKEWQEITELLAVTPKDLWITEAYGTSVYRKYAEALRILNQTRKGVEVLIEAWGLGTLDRDENLSELTKYWFTIPYFSTYFKEHPHYRKVIKEFIQSYKNDPGQFDTNPQNIFRFLLVAACEDAIDKKFKTAHQYIDTAIMIAKKYLSEKEDMVPNALFYKKTIQFYQEKHESLEKETYPFRFKCLYIPEGEVETEKNGKKEKIVASLDRILIEGLIRENRQQTAPCTLAYYYFSEGKLWMEFDYDILDVKFSNITGNLLDSMSPFPYDLMYSSYKEYDGFIYFYDNAVPGPYLGGVKNVPFFPYTVYSKSWRFHCWLKTGGRDSIYIHEIFHNFEHYFGIKPAHGYTVKNKKTWSVDYKKVVDTHGVTSQCEYYNDIFKKSILPAGLDKIKLHEISVDEISVDEISVDYSERMKKLYSEYSIDQIKKSYLLLKDANKSKSQKKNEKAEKLYKESMQVFPGNHQAVIDFANFVRYQLKDEKKGAEYYQYYIDKFEGAPETDNALVSLFWYLLWHKKDYTYILELQDNYSDYLYNKKYRQQILFYKGVSLGETGDTEHAVVLLKEASQGGSEWWSNQSKKYLEKYKKALDQSGK